MFLFSFKFMQSSLQKLVAASMLLALAACGGGGSDGGGASVPVAPNLSFESDTGDKLSNVFTLTFVFSDKVFFKNGYLPGATNIGTSSKKTVQIGNTNAYTMQFTIPPGSSGLFEFKIPPGSFFDSTGISSNKTEYVFHREYNTLPSNGPMVTFSDDAFALYPNCWLNILTKCIKGPVNITLKFSVPLKDPGLLQSNLSVDGEGVITDFAKVSVDNDVYTFKYTPRSGISGVDQITLNQNTVISQATNTPNNLSNFWRSVVDTR